MFGQFMTSRDDLMRQRRRRRPIALEDLAEDRARSRQTAEMRKDEHLRQIVREELIKLLKEFGLISDE